MGMQAARGSFTAVLTCIGMCLAAAACGASPPPRSAESPATVQKAGALSSAEFRALMRTVADGWNEGDSRKAANCFSEGAIYMEPPDVQVYEGREALYEYFGGKEQPPSPGRMTLHHVLFDEAEQIGAAEYTYQGGQRLHGIVIVRLRAGRIDRWREYQRASPLDWSIFTGKGHF